MNYFELHIGDYEKATAHLTACEDGMYGRLIRRYYDTESPLPVDVKAIQRFARARTRDEKEAVIAVLEEFFHLADDGWHHKRIDEEISRYQDTQGDAEERKRHETERKRRYRARRAELFAALREHGIVPAFDTPLDELEVRLSHLLSRGTGDGTGQGRDGDGTATQSPLPNTHTPEQELSLSQDSNSQGQPTEAGRACLLLRQAGCARVNPSNPNLLAAIRENVTPEALRDTYLEFPNVQNPFAYAIATARSRNAEGARKIATGPPVTARSVQLSKTGMAVQALEAMKSENRLGDGRDIDGPAEAGLPQLGSAASG